MSRLGRRIRVGVVGGGEGSRIGEPHRLAMRLDGHYDIAAGVLSSDPAKSLDQGARMGLARPYGTLDDMLAGERSRADGIDAVVIMTPNYRHLPESLAALDAGFHVISDKPLTNSLAEARRIAARVAETGLKLFVTYNYSGYPMVRQARAMIAAGKIGTPHFVEVKYASGELSKRIETDVDALPSRLKWRYDPARGGRSNLLLDIGTHAHQMATYVTARRLTRLFVDMGPSIEGRSMDDTAVILARLEGGLRTTLTVTKVATGAPQIFTIAVHGDEAGIEWRQGASNSLKVMRRNAPIEILGREVADLEPLTIRSMRRPEPWPEGFREAFANLYADFADVLAAEITGSAPDPLALHHPTLTDGVDGLAFIEACETSKATSSWVDLD
jgi:predicted dehydrogenase